MHTMNNIKSIQNMFKFEHNYKVTHPPSPTIFKVMN